MPGGRRQPEHGHDPEDRHAQPQLGDDLATEPTDHASGPPTARDGRQEPGLQDEVIERRDRDQWQQQPDLEEQPPAVGGADQGRE